MQGSASLYHAAGRDRIPIGEILGVDYTRDIDYERQLSGFFRDDNENRARAKNAAYRKAKVSDATFQFLLFYLSKYRELICRASADVVCKHRRRDERESIAGGCGLPNVGTDGEKRVSIRHPICCGDISGI